MSGAIDEEIYMEGVLRKKGGRVNTWGERYFVLKDHTLYYYVKAADSEPKGSFPLNPTCEVSKISSDVSMKRKQFVFKLLWQIEDSGESNKEEEPGTTGKFKHTSKNESSSATGAKVAAVAVGGVVLGALTSGIGLMAGMMVVGMGAAASGGAVAMNSASNHNKQKLRSLFLACDSYEDAETWKQVLELRIQDLGDHLMGIPEVQRKALRAKANSNMARPEVRIKEVQHWLNVSRWKVWDVYEGVRLLSLVDEVEEEPAQFYESFFTNATLTKAVSPTSVTPCMRVNVGINATPTDTFSCIVNFSKALQTGIFRSIRIVESLDNHTDVIHIKLDPVFLYPSWTAPRDFCLTRYWRDHADGSYIICLDSTHHPDCPLVEGYVRAEMHAAYVIAPPKNSGNSNRQRSNSNNFKDADEDESNESMLSFIAQVDPQGWIWSSFGYQRLFLKEIMLHVLDIRDALESERFTQVQFDPVTKTNVESNIDVAVENEIVEGTMGTIPPPILPTTMWSESDAVDFKVRGESYNTDKKKVGSAPSLFKLIAVDIFEVPSPTQNIASHPRNRVNMALKRGDPSWVFVVNIMVPGPPFLSFVVYMQGDKSKIDEDTPFGRVARPFFYGNDDEFRNNRFKLIPKVVDGNMIIKMAVKDTPTLLGNKLKQYYFKGDNYFELDVDVGSSSVARNVVGLAIGYSKAIVVDMGFVLQGNDEEELPEIIMGTSRCVRVDTTVAQPL